MFKLSDADVKVDYSQQADFAHFSLSTLLTFMYLVAFRGMKPVAVQAPPLTPQLRGAQTVRWRPKGASGRSWRKKMRKTSNNQTKSMVNR